MIYLYLIVITSLFVIALGNFHGMRLLRDQAIRDGLTGLFNRRYLAETLEREMSRAAREGIPIGAIMLDLDHFKEYNDTYGHHAGDELLFAVGQLIQEQVRLEDIPCRYGGEEFLVILPGAPLNLVYERAMSLNRNIKRLHLARSSLKPITTSAGLAVFPQHAATGNDLIRAADRALYQAKADGRDRVVISSFQAKPQTLRQIKVATG
jgi:diguanylate cyclase (GGDEF)-like protein